MPPIFCLLFLGLPVCLGTLVGRQRRCRLRAGLEREQERDLGMSETLLERVILQMPFLCFVRYIYPRNNENDVRASPMPLWPAEGCGEGVG
jgi:hypothetical protein